MGDGGARLRTLDPDRSITMPLRAHMLSGGTATVTLLAVEQVATSPDAIKWVVASGALVSLLLNGYERYLSIRGKSSQGQIDELLAEKARATRVIEENTRRIGELEKDNGNLFSLVRLRTDDLIRVNAELLEHYGYKAKDQGKAP